MDPGGLNPHFENGSNQGPSSFSLMSCFLDRATGCCLMGRAGEQQSSGCASQGLVERSEGALTHDLKSPNTTSNPLPTFAGVCDSHGRGMTSAPRRCARFCFFAFGLLRMDAQTLGEEEERDEEEEEKKRQTFVLSRMHMCCGARSGKNKAGCLLFAGCGNRFASMPSLSHEGRRRGIQKREIEGVKEGEI